MTLIELLITVAVIVIVFAIAVPVVLNITSGVQSDADSVSASARADFKAQYGDALGATLSYDSASKTTFAVFNGRTLAKIAGDATVAGNQGGQSNAVTYSVGNSDFGPTSFGWANGSVAPFMTISQPLYDVLNSRASWTMTLRNGQASSTYTVDVAFMNVFGADRLWLNPRNDYSTPVATVLGYSQPPATPLTFDSIVVDAAAGTLEISSPYPM